MLATKCVSINSCAARMARGKVIRNPVTAKHDHIGSRGKLPFGGWYLAGKNQFVVNFGGVNLIQYLRREGDI